MCRLIAYKGAPILMDQLIYQPKNSLIHQSFSAQEIEEPLNGDGFGVGWYATELEPTPAVFVSVSPAWSNRNLRYLASKIRSSCMFAHVRAASFGDTSEANCHPFHYKNFLMMHNGSIEGFNDIKRQMRRALSDEVYGWVRGQTDSEHFFALFIDNMLKLGPDYTLKAMADTFSATVMQVEKLKKEHKSTEATYINAVVTDGKFMIGCRYLSGDEGEDPLTLYFSEGSRYECIDGVCRMLKADPAEHAVLIVSEQLTDMRSDWKKVPDNNLILIDEQSNVSFLALGAPRKKKAASETSA